MNRCISRAVLLSPIVMFALFLPIASELQGQEVEFIRGDTTGDGLVTLLDPLHGLEFLISGAHTTCRAACDVNGDGTLNIVDPIYSLQYLFNNGDAPPAPFPDCGEPTDDDVSCEGTPSACALGGPIDGLTAAEVRSFNRGRVLMSKRFKPSEGLGPFYNTTSCDGCHDVPLVGGSSPIYRNFYIVQLDEPGSTQFRLPGDQPSAVMPSYNGVDGPRPRIPEVYVDSGGNEYEVRAAQRGAPPFFGVGLFEFISDETIIDNADPDDANDDGISGRYNRVPLLFDEDGDGDREEVEFIGRFGYKLQGNSIEQFIRGAALNQMGLTTDPVFGGAGLVRMSMFQLGVADPDAETNDGNREPGDPPEFAKSDFADVLAFNRFLRPPKPKPFTDAALDGQDHFDDVGCTKCHIPTLESSKGDVNAYTDLLLHNLGEDLADNLHFGRPQESDIDPDHTASEFRTQPLWGVSDHGPFMHDGRADTLHDAIVLHAGEAATVIEDYEDLSDSEKAELIEFLEAL